MQQLTTFLYVLGPGSIMLLDGEVHSPKKEAG